MSPCVAECRRSLGQILGQLMLPLAFLIRRGVNPKVVSEMLGHSSVAITLDIYSHVVPNTQQLAADAMDETLQEHHEP